MNDEKLSFDILKKFGLVENVAAITKSLCNFELELIPPFIEKNGDVLMRFDS